MAAYKEDERVYTKLCSDREYGESIREVKEHAENIIEKSAGLKIDQQGTLYFEFNYHKNLRSSFSDTNATVDMHIEHIDGRFKMFLLAHDLEYVFDIKVMVDSHIDGSSKYSLSVHELGEKLFSGNPVKLQQLEEELSKLHRESTLQLSLAHDSPELRIIGKDRIKDETWLCGLKDHVESIVKESSEMQIGKNGAPLFRFLYDTGSEKALSKKLKTQVEFIRNIEYLENVSLYSCYVLEVGQSYFSESPNVARKLTRELKELYFEEYPSNKKFSHNQEEAVQSNRQQRMPDALLEQQKSVYGPGIGRLKANFKKDLQIKRADINAEREKVLSSNWSVSDSDSHLAVFGRERRHWSKKEDEKKEEDRQWERQ